MTLSLSLARFVDQTLLSHSIFFSITCTLYHRCDYDKQKAVVVV